MAKYAYPIPNGLVNSEGLTKLISTLYTGSGVIFAGSLTVSASGTPDMNVVVSGSLKDDVAVFIADEGIAYTGWNTSSATVAIDANGTGVTMVDTVVAYIDLTAGDSVTANAPDGLSFMAVRGSGTDTAPTDNDIDTAIGHNLWIRLADVSVASGATSINSGNITDQRTQAQIQGSQLSDGGIDAAMVATGQLLRLVANDQNYKIQFGTTTTTSVAASTSTDRSIALTTPWPTAHVAFIASVAPSTSWTGVTIAQSTGPNGLSNGNVRISNGGTAQTFSVNWISIGY